MLIQAGSTYDNSLGIYNIQIKCLADDTCGVPQPSPPRLTLKDLPCPENQEKPNILPPVNQEKPNILPPVNQEKPNILPPDNKVVTVTETTSIISTVISTITNSFTTTELQKITVTETKTDCKGEFEGFFLSPSGCK
ncbi:hypothetical protein BB561_004909 [Smittium simulii]|uniref:Uncharacterized protein n=1 Tax=Smittium simulii TaxID=133385 RepID=A0A2T9YDE3_9FUNG|nr:hypothetical protein BB561_004909 [Smittium simulii]